MMNIWTNDEEDDLLSALAIDHDLSVAENRMRNKRIGFPFIKTLSIGKEGRRSEEKEVR